MTLWRVVLKRWDFAGRANWRGRGGGSLSGVEFLDVFESLGV